MSILNYECKSDINNIQIIDDILELVLKHNEFEWYSQFCFAAHELLINSVEAMSKKNSSNDILSVSIIINVDYVTFSISDAGGGLPTEVKNSYTKNDDISMDDHGRGLFLIYSLVDEFTFYEENDGRHTYKITKNIVTSYESEESLNDKK